MVGYYSSLQRPYSPILWQIDLTAESLSDLLLDRLSSGHSVQRGTNTVATTGGFTSNNVARFGRRLDADPYGLVLEETRTQRMLQNRNMLVAPWGSGTFNTITRVASDVLSPDGTIAGTHITSGPTAWGYPQSPASTDPHVISAWGRAYTGTSRWQSNYAGGFRWSVILTTAWVRQRYVRIGAATAFYPVDNSGVDTSGENVVVDLAQAENGLFETEVMIALAAAVTRAGERLYYPLGSRLVDSGRVGLEFVLQAKGASTEYSADPYLAYGDANNSARILTSSRAVTARVAGVDYTTSSTMTWAQNDILKIWIEAGGGILQTVVKYSVNGGAASTLGTSGSPQGTFAASSALDLLCAATSNQFSSRVRSIAAYRAGFRPLWAA